MIVWFTFLLGFAFAKYPVYIPPTESLLNGDYEIRIDAEYLRSRGTYDYFGEKQRFQDGEGFERIQLQASGSYGFSDAVDLTIGARFRSNKANVGIGAGETTSLSASGMDSVFAEVKWELPERKNFSYALIGGYRQRTFSNPDYNPADPRAFLVLGESDKSSVYGGLVGDYLIGRTTGAGASIFYRNPGENLSNEFVYDARFFFGGKSIAAMVGVDGIYSMNQDAYTEDPLNKPLIGEQNTELYNSINREMVRPYVGAFFGTGSTRFHVKLSYVIQGESTDEAMEGVIGLVYRPQRKSRVQRIDQKFKYYTQDATITKVIPKSREVEIDAGAEQGVERGMKFDLFYFDYLGGNELVGSGRVTKLRSSSATIRVTRKFGKRKIARGFVARGQQLNRGQQRGRGRAKRTEAEQ